MDPDDFTLTTPDGVNLRGACWGPAQAPVVLLLHGFGQTHHAWDETAQVLAAAGFRVVAPDARGHGVSDRAPDGRYRLDDFVADLRALVASLPGAPGVVGASVGGLAALLLAGDARRAPCQALVLVDITPRFETEGVERILAFMKARPEGFESLEEAGRLIAEYLPHRGPRNDLGGLADYLNRDADGRWRWHWDPRMLSDEARASAECHDRLLAAARRVQAPVMLVSGEHSDVVSRETIEEFMDAVPHARHIVVDDAHHMVVGDSNRDFNHVILAFLEDHMKVPA